MGAGIAGLGVARALRQRGLVVDLVERQRSWTHAGAGIYLPGNAARALRVLGLESAVAERASLIGRQRFCDHLGRVLADVDVAKLWGDVGSCLALHGADLNEVLATHGDHQQPRMGLAVRAISQRAGAVTVEFDDDSVDTYDLVVGADGIHSTVRHLTMGAGLVQPLGQIAWRLVTTCLAEVITWTVMLGRGVTFLAVPIGRDRVYCYCEATTARADRLPDNNVARQLADLLREFSSPVPAILDALGGGDSVPDSVHTGPIAEVVLDSWSQGAVVLVGDAAHATSPNMAEGAAMALEDGLVLAECLTSGAGVAAAVAIFEMRRRHRTQWVLTQTHRRDRTRTLPPVLRNMVLRRWGRHIVHANYRPLLDSP